MAKLKVYGVNEYLAKLNALSALSRSQVIEPAIHDGAGIVADAVRAELHDIPTDEHWGTEDHPKEGPTKAQKKGLEESLGISPIQTDDTGFVNAKVWFNGYNEVKTARWPNGQPNPMVARSIESGTSFMRPNPFIKTALGKCRQKVRKAMKDRVDKEIEKIMK